MILIAEFGNNHLGDVKKAKELIRVAKLSGATLCKGQAFLAKDIVGSMPIEFYEKCALNLMQIAELIEFGRDIGIEVFFSVFSKELAGVYRMQNWHKVAAIQTASKKLEPSLDTAKSFISIKSGSLLPDIKYAQIMYACEYLAPDPGFKFMEYLKEYYGRAIGFSDHTVGIMACVDAIDQYAVPVIEKHFTLTRDLFFKGKQYRDAIFSALPNELERIAKYAKGKPCNAVYAAPKIGLM